MHEIDRIQEVYDTIQKIKNDVQKLKTISQNKSIEKNADRILACVNILNLNVCDVLDLS